VLSLLIYEKHVGGRYLRGDCDPVCPLPYFRENLHGRLSRPSFPVLEWCFRDGRVYSFSGLPHSAIAYTDHIQTSRLANLWITEFHISFYSISPLDSIEMDSDNRDKFVKCSIDMTLHMPRFSLPLMKVTHSFRIVGGMFDRFWTCWILSRVPGTTWHVSPADELSLSDDSEDGSSNSDGSPDSSWHQWLSKSKDGFHAQRKVLELRLFEKMAKEAYKSTEEILNQVDSLLRQDVSQSHVHGALAEMLIISRYPNLPKTTPISLLLSSTRPILISTVRSPTF